LCFRTTLRQFYLFFFIVHLAIAAKSTASKKSSCAFKIKYVEVLVNHRKKEIVPFEYVDPADYAHLVPTGEEVKDVVNEVSDMVSSHLEAPKELTVVVHDKDDNMSLSPDLMQLTVPAVQVENIFAKKTVESDPTHKKTSYAHEFGHALYQINIFRFLPKLNELRAAVYKLREKRADQLMGEKVKDRKKKEADYVRIVNAINAADPAYNEVFADTVAALYKNDPEAMVKCIHSKKCGSLTYEGRSLNLKDYVADEKKWKFSSNDPHLMLSPSRPLVGKYLKNGPPGWVLERVLKVIASQVQENYTQLIAAKGDVNVTPGYVKEMNRRFIKALEEEFQRCPSVSACP